MSKVAKHMSNLCRNAKRYQAYAPQVSPGISKACRRYINNMTKMPRVYQLSKAFQVCQKYVTSMPKACQLYATSIPKLCRKHFVSISPKPSPNALPIFSQSSSNLFPINLFPIPSKSLQRRQSGRHTVVTIVTWTMGSAEVGLWHLATRLNNVRLCVRLRAVAERSKRL